MVAITKQPVPDKSSMQKPKRQGVTEQFLPKGATEVRAVQRMGGYWYTDWKFPFIHFKKEKLLVFTEKSILTYED